MVSYCFDDGFYFVFREFETCKLFSYLPKRGLAYMIDTPFVAEPVVHQAGGRYDEPVAAFPFPYLSRKILDTQRMYIAVRIVVPVQMLPGFFLDFVNNVHVNLSVSFCACAR